MEYKAIVQGTDYHLNGAPLLLQVHLIHGLPESEAILTCRDLFKRSMVKIAIEVDNTNSQEMERDMSITFAEAIGVVGESSCQWMALKLLHCPADNFWSLCRLKLA